MARSKAGFKTRFAGAVRSDRVNRRAALRMLAAGAVGAASASWVESLSALAQARAHTHAAAAAAAAQDWTPRVLTPRQNDTVVILTELIVPETDTPGAKAAGVNRIIDGVLDDARPADRQKFLDGLAWLDRRSRTAAGKDFADATAAEQIALLTRLADERNASQDDRPGVEFFRTIKSMTISGYYSTEIGLRQELGDDGQLALLQFVGCTHPEHRP